MRRILFVSVGGNDLQVLLKNNKNEVLISKVHFGIRAFHEALLRGDLPYIFCEDTEGVREYRAQSRDEEVKFREGDGFQLPSGFSLENDDGKIKFYPAKLCKVVNMLQKSVDTCIVFNTHRTEWFKGYDAEPIAAGSLIAEWLAQRFHLERNDIPNVIEARKSNYVNYLTDKMFMSGHGKDYPVNRSGMNRIDQAFKIASELYDEDVEAFLSLGGGLPEYKEQIRACAQYRFNNNISIWHETHLEESPFWSDKVQERIPTPAESFRLRHHAGELIKCGDFAGAYAAVKHMERYEVEWVKDIKLVTDYLHGMLYVKKYLPSYLETLLNNKPRCLLAGIRAESALGNNCLPEAIFWTITFFDTALLDWIQMNVVPNKTVGKINDAKAKIIFTSHPKLPSILTDPIDASPKSACMRNEPKNSLTYFYNTGIKQNTRWLRAFPSASLTALNDTLFRGHNDIVPKYLRNTLIHSHANQDMMNKAKAAFKALQLWSDEALAKPGFCFLEQDLIKNVLQEFDVHEPGKLYRGMINGLLEEMSDYEITRIKITTQHSFCLDR